MVKKQYDVVWDDVAILELQDIFEKIQLRSPANAVKVLNNILLTVKNLQYDPKKFQEDKFRKDNDGDYRAFEKDSHRVMYKIQENKVLIVGARHARRNPETHYKS